MAAYVETRMFQNVQYTEHEWGRQVGNRGRIGEFGQWSGSVNLDLHGNNNPSPYITCQEVKLSLELEATGIW